MLDKNILNLIALASDSLFSGFDLPEYRSNYDVDVLKESLLLVADKMRDNYPYHHPLYCGQMLKPPHPIALAAYVLAMQINPNNHALDGGRASSAMEKEVVADIARMFGFERRLGHLTSGGTIANLEALWVSGLELPGKKIVAFDSAHYTHSRISSVLKLEFKEIPSDKFGRIDLDKLESELKTGDVGAVVATMGTTGLGAVDDLPEILVLKEKYDSRVHCDAAYGGYFKICDEIFPDTKRKFESIKLADSVAIDPHKHGLQPYGCGCVIFSDPQVARHYMHDSPYTYYSSDDLHLGQISLECSRAGASAVALYATMRAMPLAIGGEFSASLGKCLKAARKIYEKAKESDKFFTLSEPELDIVALAPVAYSTREVSAKSKKLFKDCEESGLYLSLFNMPSEKFAAFNPDVKIDSEHVSVIRMCMMKPEHLDWAEEIWRRLETQITPKP